MQNNNPISIAEDVLLGWENFKDLTVSEIQLINDNKYETIFKAGEIIIKQGAPTSNALFILGGMAKTYIENKNGKNFILGIGLPGQIIIGPGAYVNARHSYSVSALVPVSACFVSFDILKSIVRENGAFAESLIKDISSKALLAHTRMVNLAHKKMHGRIAESLLYFADKVYKKDEYEMILSRKDLGDMTNMAKECVVRILKDLEDSGVVYSDSSRIKILDKERLIQISERG